MTKYCLDRAVLRRDISNSPIHLEMDVCMYVRTRFVEGFIGEFVEGFAAVTAAISPARLCI